MPKDNIKIDKSTKKETFVFGNQALGVTSGTVSTSVRQVGNNDGSNPAMQMPTSAKQEVSIGNILVYSNEEVKQKNKKVLEQRNLERTLGSTSWAAEGEAIIKLFDGADASTVFVLALLDFIFSYVVRP